MQQAEILRVLQSFGSCGDYSGAAVWEVNHATALLSQPRIALERARLRMRQGYFFAARNTLSSINLQAATSGEQLLIALEKASLAIFCDSEIRGTVKQAQTAFAQAQNTAPDPINYAEAERVYVRIQLIAATYREITPDERQLALNQLPRLAIILEQGGRLTESLAAQLTWAEYQPDLDNRLQALASFAATAQQHHPEFAAEAHKIRAEQMLQNGAAPEPIKSELQIALDLYTQAQHRHGNIDVRQLQAKLAIEREQASLDELTNCLRDYQQLDFPRGALSVLLDLSQLAHERGDAVAAIEFRQQSRALAEATGLQLVQANFQLAQADLFMRQADYGAAIELCERELARPLPITFQASYEQLLATSYSFVKKYDEAIIHIKTAQRLYEQLDDTASASDAIWQQASYLDSQRDDNQWEHAEELLLTWLERDEQRSAYEAAGRKLEMLAQIALNRYSWSTAEKHNLALLDKAEQYLQKAEQISVHLAIRQRAQRLGTLQQMRAQVLNQRGDLAGVEESWRKALAVYQQAGFLREAADCNYMIGVLRLNATNRDLRPNFGEAEDNLRTALTYYENSRMRDNEARTRTMLALLYANSALRVNQPLGKQMIDAALGHLNDAADLYDAIRQDYAIGSSLEALGGKQSLVENSRAVSERALTIFTYHRPDPEQAWSWVQRAKSQALLDQLVSENSLPLQILETPPKDSDLRSLLEQDEHCREKINNYSEAINFYRKRGDEDQVKIHEKGLTNEQETRKKIRTTIKEIPQYENYVSFPEKGIINHEKIQQLFRPEPKAGHKILCCDWFVEQDRIWLIAKRSGKQAKMVQLPLKASEVQAFINDKLTDYFRDTLLTHPEELDAMKALIAPLAEWSEPEELLIFSPTKSLHALPLHALDLNGEPLLVRNPIAYAYSLSIMQQCIVRRRTMHQSASVALFGDPTDDRPEAAAFVYELARQVSSQGKGTIAITGHVVTKEVFLNNIKGHRIVHFQGHAKYEPHEPMNSYLALADGKITASEIFNQRELSAELLTLIACESAASEIASGDEPSGLIPAFLSSGMCAVLATLWPVNRFSATEFIRQFYATLTNAETVMNKAQALRAAALAIRSQGEFAAPYHWAPFVLHGAWQ